MTVEASVQPKEKFSQRDIEVLQGLADDLSHSQIAKNLGLKPAEIFLVKQAITSKVKEFYVREGICKAISLAISSGEVVPRQLSDIQEVLLDSEDTMIWAMMGKGLVSYQIAAKLGSTPGYAECRRRMIARKLKVRTIYRATALAAYAMKQAGGIDQSG